MEDLRFSIVVPTRNRYETLEFCLKTCLLQGHFHNYEVVVSDNSDELESIETKKTVDDLKSDKIKYFRPATVLSMTANYEFALSKCRGEFILCIGDDDGIVPDSLVYVNELIKKFNADVIKSPVAVYHWKNSILTPNTFTFPFPVPITKVDSRSVLEKVARFELGYFNLPMIYYSFVLKSIVDKVVAAQGSFFSNAASIDMYSGLIIAYHTADFILSDLPFIISGVSGKSNGAAEQMSLKNNVSKEHYEKTGLHEMYEKYQVPQLPGYNLQLLSLLELKKFKINFQLDDDQLKINSKKVIVKFLSNTPVLDKISSLKQGDCFLEYDVYRENVNDVKNEFLDKELFYPFLDNSDIQTVAHTDINPDLFSIENVFDAAIVLRRILDGYENAKPIPITIQKKVINVSPPTKRIPFVKKYYKRVKRAGKILLRGYE